VRSRRRHSMGDWMARAERRIRLAAERGLIAATTDPRAAALAMWVIIDGLIRNWMFDPNEFDLIALGQAVIDPYLGGLRAKAR